MFCGLVIPNPTDGYRGRKEALEKSNIIRKIWGNRPKRHKKNILGNLTASVQSNTSIFIYTQYFNFAPPNFWHRNVLKILKLENLTENIRKINIFSEIFSRIFWIIDFYEAKGEFYFSNLQKKNANFFVTIFGFLRRLRISKWFFYNFRCLGVIKSQKLTKKPDQKTWQK